MVFSETIATFFVFVAVVKVGACCRNATMTVYMYDKQLQTSVLMAG